MELSWELTLGAWLVAPVLTQPHTVASREEEVAASTANISLCPPLSGDHYNSQANPRSINKTVPWKLQHLL